MSELLCPLPHLHDQQVQAPRTICTRHVERMADDLEHLTTILVHLPELYTAQPFSDHNDVRIARHDPPAPLNLAVVDLTDARSDTPALPHLEGWVRLVGEERQLSRIPAQPHAQAQFLLHHLVWLSCHPAADEAAREIHDAWLWLRGVAGLGGAQPIFTCPVVHPDAEDECGGPVFQRYERSMMVRCARCGAQWDGDLELRRAGLMLGSA